MANFKVAIDKVLENEGGYVNNPNDLGGTTNLGISLRFLQSIDATANIETIKNLTLEMAEELYFNHFWLSSNYNEIKSQIIAEKVFDTAVHTGSKVANRFLQSTLNIIIFNGKPLIEDGIIGQETINAINLLDGEDVDGNILKVYRLLQKEHYAKIVIARAEQLTFLKGWFNRADKGPYIRKPNRY